MTLSLNLTNKTYDELLELQGVVGELKERRKYNYLDFIYPDTGKYCREAYCKTINHFKQGATHRFRFIGGGNGSGKSFPGAAEVTYHVTGLYPKWWEGKRQKNPKEWWIVTESPKTFRESLQKLLIGQTLMDEDIGTGLIPKDRIVDYSAWSGASGAIDSILVRHVNGHICTISIKSTDQKRENLAAANIDGVLWDEEPPKDIHDETIARLRGTSTKEPGIGILVATSHKGLTDVMMNWAPDGIYPIGQHPTDPQKYVTILDVRTDSPHFTKEDVEMYMSNFTGAELQSRLHGEIALGSGRIYPYSEEQVFVKPFQIPDYWPRCFTLDFGHHVTCALWGAKDPHTKVLYIYSEYYCKGHQTAQIHALNIKARGDWIPGICDPSGGGRQDDGRQLVDLFRSCGLKLTPGDNSLVGISRNCNMFENGSLKIFNTLENTKREFRLYRFDTKNPNEPARNQDDHAMDCLKYKTSIFDYIAKSEFSVFASKLRKSPKRTGYDQLTGY